MLCATCVFLPALCYPLFGLLFFVTLLRLCVPRLHTVVTVTVIENTKQIADVKTAVEFVNAEVNDVKAQLGAMKSQVEKTETKTSDQEKRLFPFWLVYLPAPVEKRTAHLYL